MNENQDVSFLGNFLRKNSLDELPQFINVLIGNMSVVGPRPHMLEEDDYFLSITKKYSLRNYIKPGITGLAQAKGYRGKIFTNKDIESRIRTDIYYIRNWSFLMDLYIIFKTLLNILKGEKNAI